MAYLNSQDVVPSYCIPTKEQTMCDQLCDRLLLLLHPSRID
jgi:hypothetical protein